MAIDTLARMRGKRDRVDDLYTSDSRVTEALQSLALKRDIAVVLVHHVRKAPGADVFETISGSYGLTAPADGILVLQRQRGEADATLHTTGRDVEERELALSFHPSTSTWKLLGDARHYAQSAERRAILEAVAATPGLTPKEIAEFANLNHGSVKHLCTKLRDEARLTSDGRKRYSVHPDHPSKEDASQTTSRAVNGASEQSSPVHHGPVNAVNGVNDDGLLAVGMLDAETGGAVPRVLASNCHAASRTGEPGVAPKASSDLGQRAAARVAELRALGSAALQRRLSEAAASDRTPEWWAATALVEPVQVLAAIELFADDVAAGTLEGSGANAYLEATRAV